MNQNIPNFPGKKAEASIMEPVKSGGSWQFAYAIFKFLASLKLAILVLVSLMIILSAGTILESLYGTDAARSLVYETSWFGLVLLVLGINLAAAALDRLPWKKRHVGFVITHAGIILLLIGSYMTQKSMIDGQIVLAENETDGQITLPNPILYLADGNKEQLINLKKEAFAWQGKKVLLKETADSYGLNLLSDYPKASFTEEFGPAEEGPAAVKIRLKSSFVDQRQWLVDRDPDLGTIALGPAQLVFTDQLLKEAVPDIPSAGYFEFQFEKDQKKLTLALTPGMQTPVELPIEGTELTIQILKFYREARVEGKMLVDQSPDSLLPGKNPAAEIVIKGPGFSEKHTVFSNFPDFPTIHGMKPSAAGVHVFYRLPESNASADSRELRFVIKDKRLLGQVRSGLQLTTKEVKKGEAFQTGWMDMAVTIEEFLPASKVNRVFKPEAPNSEKPGVVPAVQVELEKAGKKYPLWLRQGVREETLIDGKEIALVYGQKRIPAGFRLTLKDFRMETYPGTTRPASYESDVILKDDTRGVVREATISMNEPLVYHGFKIYQSGYSAEPGQPEISIFAVGCDPGVPVKYLGTIVMVIGILFMFYTKRFSTTSGRPL